MLKKTIQLCITFVSSFVLSFILLYSFLINKLESANASLIVTILTSALLAVSFCNLRNILLLRKKHKQENQAIEDEYKRCVLYMSNEQFAQSFAHFKCINEYQISNNIIITKDRIYGLLRQLSMVNEDQILEFIRLQNSMPDKEVSLLIIAPCDENITQMIINNKIEIIPNDIIKEFVKIEHINYTYAPKNKKQKILGMLSDKIFGKKCFRYGLTLFIISIFSLYRFWYIFAGTIFLILAFTSLYIRRKNQSKTIV